MVARKIEDEDLLALTEEHGHNAYAIAKVLGMDHSGIAARLRKLNRHKQFAGIPSVTPVGKRFVVTCAVSGCEANKPFLAALRRYCKAQDAQLLIVPLRYRNPTSKLESPEDWFDTDLLADVCHGRFTLATHLQLMADVPTQPTAARPLSGLATMTGADSAIYPHPKVALESVPTGPGQHAKLIATTGAVTLPRYSNSKAGKKGEFHHVCGALIVEVEGKSFHLRHINADHTGGFQDIGHRWSARGSAKVRAQVLTMGDLHGVRHDPVAVRASIDMLHELDPANLILHDVLDFESASHHNTFIDSFRLHHAGRGDVETELRGTGEVVERIVGATRAQVWIVQSNHHDHLMRWLNDKRAAHDVQNALIYHWLKASVLAAAARGEHVNPFELAIRHFFPGLKRVHFIESGQSLCIDGVEYGYHGHQGPNGARGSLGAFTRVAVKVTVGHSHTPGIMDGVYQVGTTSLMDLGYNRAAPSSWMHTNCVQYADGKRALLHIIGGHWHAKSKRTEAA